MLLARLAVLLFLALSVAHAEPKGPPRGRFWKDFRRAFLQEDFAVLAKMTRFPVEVKGLMDDDPILKVTKKQFERCFGLLFRRDTGLKVSGQNHRDFVQTMLQAPPSESEDSFRVADLVFEQGKKGFELVRFYLDTADRAVARKCSK